MSLLCGAVAGSSSALFLILLNWATQTRIAHSFIIWALPIAGWIIGWVYYRYGKDVAAGNNLIIDEIHNPKKVIPLRMAPFILLGTVLTHLFGGSAGREGTAVQMGASLSDQLSKIFKVDAETRKRLLMSGAGAGFGAAIGAPWAGAVFGMEVLQVRHFRLFGWWECLIASFAGFATALGLHAPHSAFPHSPIPPVNLSTMFFVAIAGVVFGLSARFFISLAHLVERISSTLIQSPPWRPFWGGVLLVALYFWEGSYRFVGLGIDQIQSSLQQSGEFSIPLLKAGFTALTVGSGFKGGEFIPLVFIGTSLGSALSQIMPVSVHLLAPLGFAAVFGAAANTPFACALMAMEIFGLNIGPYALIACLMSYYISGPKGIYKSQKVPGTVW